MKKPVSCRYFHGDYFRGANREECRLLESSPDGRGVWERKLCESCPVPALVIASNSRHLALEAEVQRKFLRRQVEVTFAVCTKHMEQLADPHYCPKCAREQNGAGG